VTFAVAIVYYDAPNAEQGWIWIKAEPNAEIEHASPYRKAPEEKVAGEAKKDAAVAERARGVPIVKKM
jgi:hypothetical protein